MNPGLAFNGPGVVQRSKARGLDADAGCGPNRAAVGEGGNGIVVVVEAVDVPLNRAAVGDSGGLGRRAGQDNGAGFVGENGTAVLKPEQAARAQGFPAAAPEGAGAGVGEAGDGVVAVIEAVGAARMVPVLVIVAAWLVLPVRVIAAAEVEAIVPLLLRVARVLALRAARVPP